MIPSVSSGADRELTEGAAFYASEGGTEVGLIIYYLRDEDLRVVALAHHRRKPEYWSGRS
ncbi:MAG TPA: hypothetical protein VMS53_05020 [Burkholderiales bacterium]|nr:hypothetical protein [Burkholderiales bacterium]